MEKMVNQLPVNESVIGETTEVTFSMKIVSLHKPIPKGIYHRKIIQI